MPLFTTHKMLLDARKNSYAVAAFNCENTEMIQAVIAAGEEMDAPVIIQTTPTTVNYASLDLFVASAAALARDANIPVALHLDHGNTYELAEAALLAGYTSIMIDGSHLPFEENIAITKMTVDTCAAEGIPVEGELGRVGGKEDDTAAAGCIYTDPEEALRFIKETGVSSLAVGVGTAHGVYASKPLLNTELISVLKDILPVPLVLHGSSGLDDAVIQDCIKRGISKVNIATDLRFAYTQAVRDFLKQDPDCFDPKKYGAAALQAVKKNAINRIIICGCQGRANIS